MAVIPSYGFDVYYDSVLYDSKIGLRLESMLLVMGSEQFIAWMITCRLRIGKVVVVEFIWKTGL